MRKRSFFEVILLGKSILFKEGLGRILNGAGFRVVGSVDTAEEISSIKRRVGPGALLIVYSSDGADYTREQLEEARELLPSSRIAVVTDRYRPQELVSAARAGAHGYFVDAMTCDLFVKSLELIMMGQNVFPPAFISDILGTEGNFSPSSPASRISSSRLTTMSQERIDPELSPRELTILQYLIEGDSNKCIARKIDIAEATVKVHVKAILRKIRVQNRTQAAIWGLNNGPLARQAGVDSPPPSMGFANMRNIASSMTVSERVVSPAPALVHTVEGGAVEMRMLGLEGVLSKGNIRKVVRD